MQSNPFLRYGLAAGLLTFASVATASDAMSSATETVSYDSDKTLVLDFHEAAFACLDLREAHKYLSASFIQHDPAVEDGVAGFAKFHASLRSAYPRYSSEVRRAISSGGLVTIHVLQRLNPWERGDVQVHMYRVVGGKIAEHWVAGNPIPATSLNANGLI
ncbi:nuclear transport factor 2 family protein [Pinirhizobacter sp.]|jgi:predicted SnoaL-like aldol condensation-catalyzing enzyme|uniref:nuclear transport factor 2 family protein n=1 Tax=Pinirhizobacter sp. TaxID=2950432 RepID=UPI002F42B84E